MTISDKTTSSLTVAGRDGGRVDLTASQLEDLDARLSGRLLAAGDDGWDEAVTIWNGMVAKTPALVVQPDSARDVATTVTFARDHGILLSVKGGGHNIAGIAIADGGLTLDVHGLTAGYGDLTVLRDVGLTARPGELLLVAGANGAGKTTLLGCVSGTVRRCQGSIRLGDTELLGRAVHERTRAGIGLVPEGRGLFPSLTVKENLRVAARAARLGKAEREAGIEAAVATFPIIGERMAQRVSTLSGGQQQMVSIGRALLARPRVLLLDEPSTGLAPIVWREVLATCRRLADSGHVVVLVEQRIRQALTAADRCVVLQQGRVVQDTAAETIRAQGGIARGYFATVLPTATESPAATGSTDGGRPGRPA